MRGYKKTILKNETNILLSNRNILQKNNINSKNIGQEEFILKFLTVVLPVKFFYTRFLILYFSISNGEDKMQLTICESL